MDFIMEYRQLACDGPVLIIPVLHGDARGFFMETWRENDFNVNCGRYKFVQDNCSMSVKGVLRGMHYQVKQPQGKLVRVSKGKVFDAAVDLRASSPTFGQYFSAVLDDVSHHMLWIPPGFAHGFCVLSDTAEFVYKCTEYYAPEHEFCLRWDDPSVGIAWPELDQQPVISDKDKKGLFFSDCPRF